MALWPGADPGASRARPGCTRVRPVGSADYPLDLDRHRTAAWTRAAKRHSAIRRGSPHNDLGQLGMGGSRSRDPATDRSEVDMRRAASMLA